MASGRAHLESIIHWAGKLQAMSDDQLESVNTDLNDVDNILDGVVDALENPED